MTSSDIKFYERFSLSTEGGHVLGTLRDDVHHRPNPRPAGHVKAVAKASALPAQVRACLSASVLQTI